VDCKEPVGVPELPPLDPPVNVVIIVVDCIEPVPVGVPELPPLDPEVGWLPFTQGALFEVVVLHTQLYPDDFGTQSPSPQS